MRLLYTTIAALLLHSPITQALPDAEQISGVNGKNILASMGSGVGLPLCSDCRQQPAESVPATYMPNMPSFTLNGLKLTPVNGFPKEAFMGIPPIVTPEDVLAATKMVRALADISRKARTENPELSILSMYWAKRISATTVSILSSSLYAIKTNTGTSARIPAKGLVILPAFNEFGDDSKQTLQLGMLEDKFAVNEHGASKGVMVADNGGFGAALDFLSKVGTPPAQQVSQAPAAAQPKALVGLPLNTAFRMPDGMFVIKTNEALTIFNPNDTASDLPLDKLDFMARTTTPSPARQAVAPLMFAMNGSSRDWSFSNYQRRVQSFENYLAAPNRIIDINRGRQVAAYLNEAGQIDQSPDSGERAYRTNAIYKRAMDTMVQAVNSTPVRLHTNACYAANRNYYDAMGGKYATLLQSVCHEGPLDNKVYVRTFYIGGDGSEIVQTPESLNRNGKNQQAMTEAMINGEALSDALSFVPGAENINNSLQCIGDYTFSQLGFISQAVMDTGAPANSLRVTPKKYNIAVMAGWTPPSVNEWDLGRVTSCVNAMPPVTPAVSTVKVGNKTTAQPDTNVLSEISAARLDLIYSAASAFNSPLTLREYVRGASDVKALIPGNPSASAFVKTIHDTLITGQNMYQTANGLATLYAKNIY